MLEPNKTSKPSTCSKSIVRLTPADVEGPRRTLPRSGLVWLGDFFTNVATWQRLFGDKQSEHPDK